MNSKTLFCIAPLFLTACLSRAPTEFELDKRAGFVSPMSPILKDESVKNIEGSVEEVKPSFGSPRRGPAVKKIWVYSQVVDNRLLQGTWMWVEVDKGRWDFAAIKASDAPLAKTEQKLK